MALAPSQAGLTDVLPRHILPQFLQPDFGLGIARSPPVAARRERAAGADLRAVGNCRALELADLKEAIEEHLEPLLHRRQVIFDSLARGPRVRAVLPTPARAKRAGRAVRADIEMRVVIPVHGRLLAQDPRVRKTLCVAGVQPTIALQRVIIHGHFEMRFKLTW